LNISKPELLSPCGDIESVYAAVNNGCDAIYIGGKNFNARQYASNFSDEDLKYIIDYCHLRNVKVFITVNILYKDEEINKVLKFVSKVYSYGADALIIQDIGMFNIIKNNFRDIKLHASTQMTIHNIQGVKFLYKMGFDRIVLSRELSMEEIKDIINYINKNSMNIEIETFVHGALCVCYSGRCLMSSIIGGRSGNRGRCAQPCRKKYKLIKDGKVLKESYLLSTKDISTIQIIDKLIESGITTFKIEGRMKSPEYVAQVTKTYRKYIEQFKNNKFKIEEEDIYNLTQIFNRGGSFSQGYFTNWSGIDMISSFPKSSGVCIGKVESYNKKEMKCTIIVNDFLTPGDGIEIWTQKEPHCGTNISIKATPKDKITISILGNIKKGDLVFKSYSKNLNDSIKKSFSKQTRQQKVEVYLTAKIDKPLNIKLKSENGVTFEYNGEVVQCSKNQPVTKERLLNQLSKTGGTPFFFDFKKCEIDNNIYIPISVINSFRRDITEKFQQKIIQSYRRNGFNLNYNIQKNELTKKREITVSVSNKEQFDVAVKYNIGRIYINIDEFICNANYYIEKCHKNNIELFISLLRILRKTTKNNYDDILNNIEKYNIDGYLLKNYQEINTNKKIAADYTFNVFNNLSKNVLLNYFDTVALSNELNIKELNNLAGDNTEVNIYGYITVMTTHQCPVGLHAAGKRKGMFCKLKGNKEVYYIRDKMNVDFPIITDCKNCTAAILNSNPIFLLNKFEEILKLKSNFFRLDFTIETAKETDEIIYSYLEMFELNTSLKTKRLIDKMIKKGFTSGHFFRGVL